MIYLDNAATTCVDERVLQAMMPWFLGKYGNPGSLHSLGREAKAAVESARAQIAALINCDPEQVVFTSGGSEANNLAIKGSLNWRDGVLLSATEHESIWSATEGESYHRSTIAATSTGKILPYFMQAFSLNDYRLATVMCVNNEVGVINPVKAFAALCHKHGMLFHTDCVQALGSVNVDVKDINCDFASFSSHKIHGPKGVGALYVKKRDTLRSLVSGGADQEFGLRGGTENVAGIVGFGEACRILQEEFEENIAHIKNLRETFLRGISSVNDVSVINAEATPKILNLRFEGVDAQTLVLMADAYGVCISAGSACHSHSNEPSRTLLAMRLTEDEARSCIRVSFSADNSIQEVEDAARIIGLCVKTLRYSSTTQALHDREG